MKKYLKELIILFIQLFMFYIFPLFCGPTDVMGMVLLIIFSVFVLSIILSIISNSKIKYLYPIIIAILFIPSIFIYYNITALVHSLWYLVISSIGLGIGCLVNLIMNRRW